MVGVGWVRGTPIRRMGGTFHRKEGLVPQVLSPQPSADAEGSLAVKDGVIREGGATQHDISI